MEMLLPWSGLVRSFGPPLTDRGPTRPLAGLLAGGFALLVACGLALDAQALERSDQASSVTVASIASSERVRHPRNKTFMKRQWGVEVVFVRRTAGGYMLEFRYKVLDPDKAKPLFDRQTKPLLTHVESGARICRADAGQNRRAAQLKPAAGRAYLLDVFRESG